MRVGWSLLLAGVVTFVGVSLINASVAAAGGEPYPTLSEYIHAIGDELASAAPHGLVTNVVVTAVLVAAFAAVAAAYSSNPASIFRAYVTLCPIIILWAALFALCLPTMAFFQIGDGGPAWLHTPLLPFLTGVTPLALVGGFICLVRRQRPA